MTMEYYNIIVLSIKEEERECPTVLLCTNTLTYAKIENRRSNSATHISKQLREYSKVRTIN